MTLGSSVSIGHWLLVHIISRCGSWSFSISGDFYMCIFLLYWFWAWLFPLTLRNELVVLPCFAWMATKVKSATTYLNTRMHWINYYLAQSNDKPQKYIIDLAQASWSPSIGCCLSSIWPVCFAYFWQVCEYTVYAVSNPHKYSITNILIKQDREMAHMSVW